MPRKKKKEPLSGVGEKEERMYEHIKESAQKSGRYGDRAEEVAARTVMKHHKEEGHKKGQQGGVFLRKCSKIYAFEQRKLIKNKQPDGKTKLLVLFS